MVGPVRHERRKVPFPFTFFPSRPNGVAAKKHKQATKAAVKASGSSSAVEGSSVTDQDFMWACSSGELGKVDSMLHDGTGNLNAHDEVEWGGQRGGGGESDENNWNGV